MSAVQTEILDKISSMTVLELSELIKAMEDKFGVSAAAAVSVAAPAAGAATATAAAAETPNLSSIALMSSESSRTDIDEILSRISVWAADIVCSWIFGWK